LPGVEIEKGKFIEWKVQLQRFQFCGKKIQVFLGEKRLDNRQAVNSAITMATSTLERRRKGKKKNQVSARMINCLTFANATGAAYAAKAECMRPA